MILKMTYFRMGHRALVKLSLGVVALLPGCF